MNTNDTPSAVLDLATLAAVSDFCSKKETRYYLRGVLIEIDADGVTYVATDGHRLAARRVSLPKDAAANTLVGQWIIPLEECKAFRLRRGPAAEAVLALADGWLDVTYLGNARRFRPVDGTFPDWRRIVPSKADGALKLAVNATYLASVYKLGQALNIGPVVPHWNNGDACAFTFGDDASAFCLIMPICLKIDTPWAPPAWLRSTVKEAA
jgi:DNA polymerase-3 subunit beta